MAASKSSQDFQKFLDTAQYSRRGVLLYERIFGDTFVSTGGLDTTRRFCSELSLRPDNRVLDIGCGIGGSPFFLARNYGAFVYGVDLSTNMIDIAENYRYL